MALFVGQWPPTFLLMAIVHKILRPSRDSRIPQTQQAAEEAGHMVSGR
jgi:hypothetical protein